MKKIWIWTGLGVIFAAPVWSLWFFKREYVNFDTISALLFVIIVTFLIAKHRKKLDIQVMLGIGKIPLLYAVLWRTKFGLKFMEKIATRFREFVRLLGYCFVGFGFFGMIFISVNLLFMLFKLFTAPKEAAEGVALILPFTNIPGIGFLSFWHFLITIFITVLIHEFAHGIVARAHKVPVNHSGLGAFSLIVPLIPLAFVEPDEKKLPKEKDIVQYSIFAAGPIINIIFAFLLLVTMPFVVNPALPAPGEEGITFPVGISFNDLMDGYPAQDVGLEPGTVINKVNGVEVLEYSEFTDKLGTVKPGDQILLGTDKGDYQITAKEGEEDPDRGFIGILGVANERRIKDEYSLVGVGFFWIKGLLKWLFWINFLVGLMNLLPIIITDGGRMLKTAAEKILMDVKKADKIVGFIGLVFIGTLLFAFFVKYGMGFLNLAGFS